MINVIIIEDELPAYKKLETYTAAHIPDSKVIGWARSVEEAKDLIDQTNNIDLIISDIELLDGNSFEIFEEVKVNCPIIFCTAFDKYLFKAFQTNGIAYILKPYTEESFKEAIGKYINLFNTSSDNKNIESVKSLITSLKLNIEMSKISIEECTKNV